MNFELSRVRAVTLFGTKEVRLSSIADDFAEKSRTLFDFLAESFDEKNTLHQHYADFLIERQAHLSERTIQNFENTFKIFHFLRVEDFERRNFLEFCAGHAPPSWTRNTLNLNLQNLCKFSAWLQSNKLTTRRFRLEKKSYRAKRRHVPTFAEIEAIFEALKSNYQGNLTAHRKHHHQLYLITRILYATGARISEALGIYLQDVEIRNGKYFVVLEGSKSYDSQRSVEIDKELFDELWEFRDKYKIRARLFSSERGNKFSRIQYSSSLKELGERLGIEAKIHAHVFRYMFVLKMICDGRSAFEVMTRCGHKDVQMTLYYFDQVRRLFPDANVSADISLLQRQAEKRKRIFGKKQNFLRGENYDD